LPEEPGSTVFLLKNLGLSYFFKRFEGLSFLERREASFDARSSALFLKKELVILPSFDRFNGDYYFFLGGSTAIFTVKKGEKTFFVFFRLLVDPSSVR
jgi:hypothetical protein